MIDEGERGMECVGLHDLKGERAPSRDHRAAAMGRGGRMRLKGSRKKRAGITGECRDKGTSLTLSSGRDSRSCGRASWPEKVNCVPVCYVVIA
jgi:hypothetical protein